MTQPERKTATVEDIDAAFLAAYSPASLKIPLVGPRSSRCGVSGVDRPTIPHIQLPDGTVRAMTRPEHRCAARLIAKRAEGFLRD